MNDFFKVIGGIVTIVVLASYCLAAGFAPFGIIYLVFFQ